MNAPAPLARRRLTRTASLTAQVNAAQRAAETMRSPRRRLLDDPWSRHFVDHPALRAVLTNRWLAGAAVRVFDRQWGGLHAHIVLRARFTDDVCAAAVSDGIDQLVLLGAGFDTTSLRKARSSVTMFEVDAGTTQAAKRPTAERLLPAPRTGHIVWVPCDLEQDSLRDRLLAGGFAPQRRSLVVWLGVSMYLTAEAIEATLSDLAALCAPGSRLIADYIDTAVVTGESRSTGARRIARVVARRGEPYRSGFTLPGLDALLAAHGFGVRDHAGVAELLDRYDPTHTSGLAADDWLGVVCAERTGR
ncbi:SAM-dependent methyltransferase [Mycolicibacter kumamotonensis]|uniref:S-adenosyl-L-methionine-dependent methyltransferase n=1 Tax=Mycolicibacter kumamotonensis TaxID=354243 RepID=A0A1X0E7Y1_9MYCO|nr:SAM-dependent methyltransferase [Mycolicibacter kumamotonensis]